MPRVQALCLKTPRKCYYTAVEYKGVARCHLRLAFRCKSVDRPVRGNKDRKGLSHHLVCPPSLASERILFRWEATMPMQLRLTSRDLVCISRRASVLALVVLAVAVLEVRPAAAQTLTWDNSGASPAAPADGSGN